MEGRKPPPYASHPFPNNPNLDKFWNTPIVKPFLKSFALFSLLFGVLAGTNMYLTRHQRGPFGMDVLASQEEITRRQKVLKDASWINVNYGLNLDYKSQRNNFSLDPNIRFDDGVNFNAPTDEQLVLPIR